MRIRVRVERGPAAFSVYLVLTRDGRKSESLPMKWLGLNAGYDEYELTLEGLLPGLYWYWFKQDVFGDETAFGRESLWQLTVYRAGYETPDWFDSGVTYHIFVDRFLRVGEPPASKHGRAYRLHEHWSDAPDIYPADAREQSIDFFGGNLRGIEEKLDYLESLGVTTLFLSPIFEAASNHRYDTGDYMKIDPMLGDEADFRRLCEKARERGMRVLLDGVFNHTGNDSRYFNARGLYDSVGAAQSQDSPYVDWYTFRHWPDDYACWWGIKTLPQTNKTDRGWIRFSLEDGDSVVKHWLNAGASGWRLDVVDELPRDYVERLRRAVKEAKADAAVIGEVWEDASNKTSYGRRRRYFQGRELDGVMNYPAREAILGFVTGKITSEETARALMTLHEHYPAPSRRCLMNLLGTHDTARILTVLGCGEKAFELPRQQKADYCMSRAETERGKARLKLASALQYMLPGSPCLYYGDEAGLLGFEDPLNRRGYPWGNEDTELLEWYRALGAMRKTYAQLFRLGSLEATPINDGAMKLMRKLGGVTISAVVNRSDTPLEFAPEPGSVFVAGNGSTPLPPGCVAIFTWND